MSNNFDLDEIEALLKILSEYDVQEFKLVRGDDDIWLRRGVAAESREKTAELTERVTSIVRSLPQQTHSAREDNPASDSLTHESRSSAVAQVGTTDTAGVEAPEEVQPVRPLFEVTSPMVGTFYRRPAVDADPYVEVGSIVKKGDVLCIVEAMKLMNEIESEYAGRIVEICLEDAQMVEYGEVLFRIDPSI